MLSLVSTYTQLQPDCPSQSFVLYTTLCWCCTCVTSPIVLMFHGRTSIILGSHAKIPVWVPVALLISRQCSSESVCPCADYSNVKPMAMSPTPPPSGQAGCHKLTKTLNQNGSRGHRHVEPVHEYTYITVG